MLLPAGDRSKNTASVCAATRAEYVELAEALLEMVGLKGFGDKFPWQLSAHAAARKNSAALIHKPELLMLDDLSARWDALHSARNSAGQSATFTPRMGVTIVLVTHDLREGAFLADRDLRHVGAPGRITRRARDQFPRPRELEH